MGSPFAKKIFVGILLLVIGGYGLYEVLSRSNIGIVSPRFIDKRNEVAALLKNLASTPDTDLSPLGIFEQKKDYVGALNELENVTKANNDLISLINVLIQKTDAIITEGEKIGDVILRPQALGALAELQRGNRLMLDYFKYRGELFLKLKNYYSDIIIKGSASPPDLSPEVKKIDEHIAGAKSAYELFNQKIDVFDRAAGLKYQSQ
jgi:hypothetical protein